MNNSTKSAPYLHSEETVVNLKLDLLMGLLAVMLIATIQNGLRVITVCFVSSAAGWVAETIGRLIFKKGFFAGLRSVSTGLILAMLCPVSVPIWLPALATMVSVFFIDVVLWPNYSRLFITPAIGWLFMLSIKPGVITNYPRVGNSVIFPLFGKVEEFVSVRSIAQTLQYRQTPAYSFTDLLVGRYPGGMGTTCILMILAVCVYFIVRRSMAWEVSLSMILTVSVIAVIFNRTDGNAIHSIIYELTAASFVYMAVFVAGDIMNAPMLTFGKIACGVLIGVLAMLFRYIGLGEHSSVLALTAVNLLSGLLDLAALKFQVKITRKKITDKFA